MGRCHESIRELRGRQLDQQNFVNFLLRESGSMDDLKFEAAVKMQLWIARFNGPHRARIEAGLRQMAGPEDLVCLTAEQFFVLGQPFHPIWEFEDCLAIFSEVDKNKDGTVDLYEFLAHLGKFTASVPTSAIEFAVRSFEKKCRATK